MKTLLYPSFFDTYISETDTSRSSIDLLEEGMRASMLIFKFLPLEKANYRYATGKWTVKEVLGHMIDTEMVMAYRALCISRGEKQSLPGFDENEYVANANFNSQTIGDLLEHYKMVRFGNILLFKGLSKEMFDRQGVANGAEINVRALAYIIVGHEAHHLKILRERYGLK